MIASPLRHDTDMGFTLIELMTVVVIIAILLAVAVATFMSTTASANAAACKYNQRSLNEGIAVMTSDADAPAIAAVEDVRPYVKNFNTVSKCPSDGTPLQLDAGAHSVICPNHP